MLDLTLGSMLQDELLKLVSFFLCRDPTPSQVKCFSLACSWNLLVKLAHETCSENSSAGLVSGLDLDVFVMFSVLGSGVCIFVVFRRV